MKKLITLSALSLLSVAALAEGKTETGINYNEVSVGYISQGVDNDGATDTFTGYGISGSFLISDSVFLTGAYNSTNHTYDDLGKITLSGTKIGLGYRMPLSDTTDLNVLGSYTSYSANTSPAQSQTSYGAYVGVRSVALSPDLETSIFYGYGRKKDWYGVSSNVSSYMGGLKYAFMKNVTLNLDFTSQTKFTEYVLGVGYKF
mgnify:CR=1 FL=1